MRIRGLVADHCLLSRVLEYYCCALLTVWVSQYFKPHKFQDENADLKKENDRLMAENAALENYKNTYKDKLFKLQSKYIDLMDK